MRGLLVCLAAATLARGQQPDPGEIIRRAFVRDENLADAARNYTYVRDQRIRQMDGAGKTKSEDRVTSEVLVLYGRPYSRIIAKNGKPLADGEAKSEQSKLDKEMARRKKRADQSEVEGDEKRRHERQKALREIADAFHFELRGSEPVSGQDTWIIDAKPRPGYRPKTSDARVFAKMSGRLWIDKAEYRVAKVDAHVDDTISIGWFLFRIAPGFRFQLEQVRLPDAVWLPRQAALRGSARLGLVKTINLEADWAYSDYRKFQSESRLVASEEQQRPAASGGSGSR